MTTDDKRVAKAVKFLTNLRDGYQQKIREGSADGYWDHLKPHVDQVDDIIALLRQARAQDDTTP
jgi:hypothetical protein